MSLYKIKELEPLVLRIYTKAWVRYRVIHGFTGDVHNDQVDDHIICYYKCNKSAIFENLKLKMIPPIYPSKTDAVFYISDFYVDSSKLHYNRYTNQFLLSYLIKNGFIGTYFRHKIRGSVINIKDMIGLLK